MKIIKSQRGFILIVALIACVILAALGVLVISLSTGDQKTSSATLGEKRALGAFESGFHTITRSFDASIPPLYGLTLSTWQNVDPVNAPGAQYSISKVATSKYPPVQCFWYSLGFELTRFDLTMAGRDTTYNSQINVDMGAGYGPVYAPSGGAGTYR
jgi:type II secretory pathway pseudopilin PulG